MVLGFAMSGNYADSDGVVASRPTPTKKKFSFPMRSAMRSPKAKTPPNKRPTDENAKPNLQAAAAATAAAKATYLEAQRAAAASAEATAKAKARAEALEARAAALEAEAIGSWKPDVVEQKQGATVSAPLPTPLGNLNVNYSGMLPFASPEPLTPAPRCQDDEILVVPLLFEATPEPLTPEADWVERGCELIEEIGELMALPAAAGSQIAEGSQPAAVASVAPASVAPASVAPPAARPASWLSLIAWFLACAYFACALACTGSALAHGRLAHGRGQAAPPPRAACHWSWKAIGCLPSNEQTTGCKLGLPMEDDRDVCRGLGQQRPAPPKLSKRRIPKLSSNHLDLW